MKRNTVTRTLSKGSLRHFLAFLVMLAVAAAALTVPSFFAAGAGDFIEGATPNYYNEAGAGWAVDTAAHTLTHSDVNGYAAVTFDFADVIDNYTFSGKAAIGEVNGGGPACSLRFIFGTAAGLTGTGRGSMQFLQMSKNDGGYANDNFASGWHPAWGWNADSVGVGALDLPAAGSEINFNFLVNGRDITANINGQVYKYTVPSGYAMDYRSFGFEIVNTTATITDLAFGTADFLEGATPTHYKEAGSGWAMDIANHKLVHPNIDGYAAITFDYANVIDNYTFSGKATIDEVNGGGNMCSLRFIFGTAAGLTGTKRGSMQFLQMSKNDGGYANDNFTSGWNPTWGWTADSVGVGALDLPAAGAEIDFKFVVSGNKIKATVNGQAYTYTIPDAYVMDYRAFGFEAVNTKVTVTDLEFGPKDFIDGAKTNYYNEEGAGWTADAANHTLKHNSINGYAAVTFDFENKIDKYSFTGKAAIEEVNAGTKRGSLRFIFGTVTELAGAQRGKMQFLQMSKNDGGYENLNYTSGWHPTWGWVNSSSGVGALDLPAGGSEIEFSFVVDGREITAIINGQVFTYSVPFDYAIDYKAFGFETVDAKVAITDLNYGPMDDVDIPVTDSFIEGAAVNLYSEGGQLWEVDNENKLLKYSDVGGYSAVTLEFEDVIRNYTISGTVTIDGRYTGDGPQKDQQSLRFIFGAPLGLNSGKRDYMQMLMMSKPIDGGHYFNDNYTSGWHPKWGWTQTSIGVPSLDLTAELETIDFEITIKGQAVAALINGDEYTYNMPDDWTFDVNAFGFEVQSLAATVSNLAFTLNEEDDDNGPDLPGLTDDEDGEDDKTDYTDDGDNVGTGEPALPLLLAVSIAIPAVCTAAVTRKRRRSVK